MWQSAKIYVFNKERKKVMALVISISVITCITMIAGILFFPQIKIKNLKIDSYWVIALLGAILTVAVGGIDIKFLAKELINDSAINPIKILILFISMTVLSVFLDEVGFFRYLACVTLKRAKNSQKKLFICLYITVSVLTIFTSNDIIVLTFTPFICYFAKNAKINPLPYLINEFVAANTLSMMLIIGNPTNIYIATSYGINFFDYFKVMVLPTLAGAVVAFAILYLLFRNQLKKEITGEAEQEKIHSKAFLVIGLVHLIICTIVLAIGPYIGIEMYFVAAISAVSLIVIILIASAINKQKPIELKRTIMRSPWQLIPFVLSMFTLILALKNCGVTKELSILFGKRNFVFKYGILSFISANIINNIPMSVLFCPIMESLSGELLSGAIYATIIGSNIGAYLTPIGALAGIMWTGMLKKHDVKLSYLKFVGYGLSISLPTILTTLAVLSLII